MARPEKSKRICALPSAVSFFSERETAAGENRVVLSIEEFETIRQIDHNGLTQEECAGQMHVSRTTVQRMYNTARQKIAAFLVNGGSLQICGGNYELCGESERCCKRSGCPGLQCSVRDPSAAAQCSPCPLFTVAEQA